MLAVRNARPQRLPSTFRALQLIIQSRSLSTSTQDTSSPTSGKASSSSSSTKEGSTSKAPAKGRKRPQALRRPPISLSKPREWNRPVREGLIPAYDEALKYILEDSQKLKVELKEVKEEIEKLEGSLSKAEDSEIRQALDSLKKREEILEVQSEVNLPDVRWKAANAMVDMSKPVYRFLIEQKWRKMGALDLLMERIYQMNVVPDILPAFHPSVDLRIVFPVQRRKTAFRRPDEKQRQSAVEPGVFLVPEQTLEPPRVFTTVFHPDERYYTLLMIDADVPNQREKSFTTYLHWMIPNLKLSATSSQEIILSGDQPSVQYIPPHPQRGTPYHRYVLFLLPHTNPTSPITYPFLSTSPSPSQSQSQTSSQSPTEPLTQTPNPTHLSTNTTETTPRPSRLGFDVRSFCREFGLNGTHGGGVHMWREVWDETVSEIYKNSLHISEPRYGIPRKPDAYAEVKELKRKGILSY